jgi:hypothetical protein
MNTKGIQTQGGFTIIEVLMSAIIFMIGFSILVFMLNQIVANYSVRDITTANRLASTVMEKSFQFQETLSLDTVIVVTDVAYRVQKSVRVDDGLAAVTVKVMRRHQSEALCTFYGEFLVSADKE